MTNLTETQRTVLTAAANREDGSILPLPAHIRGGAVTKVINALLTAGLITEAPHTISPAGLAAIGRTPAEEATVIEAKPEAPETLVTEAEAAQPEEVSPAPEPPVRKTREGSKQALLIQLLQRPEGATVDQIAEATGWLKHTIRGAISGALKKKLGLTITTERIRMVGPNRVGAPGSMTIYRINPAN